MSYGDEEPSPMSLILSFDIGYASIGWCVLAPGSPHPEFLGTGVVTFPSDDCLASQRRTLRRTRRHIRSTRQRIERMKRWLSHNGVLGREDLDKPGHPAPFLLASAALQGHRILNAWELWTVLRWYAHNRGYDGNARWSRGEEEPEDTEKLANARELMAKHGTATMAETICACLGLDPAQHDQRISSQLPYKTLNAAYPRSIVSSEVSRLLALHQDKIAGLTGATIRLLLTEHPLTSEARAALGAAGIDLPRRYHGGLLFGQLVPRFDNRIIARCPITWAKTYDEALASGKTDAEARREADKFAKVPTAKTPEFLRYRFARILANIRADGRPLPPALRQKLWKLAEERGSLTPTAIAKVIHSELGDVATNLEAYFKIHPDSADALLLDPALAFSNTNQIIKAVWPHLTKETADAILTRWRRGGSVCLAEIQQLCGMSDAVLEASVIAHDASMKRARKKSPTTSLDEFLTLPLSPKKISGRAPYARPVLEAVVREVLDGFDPTRSAAEDEDFRGNRKTADGILHPLGIPGSRVRQLQAARPIDQLTNNHLVRHRLLILDRLVDDLVAEFCTGGRRIGQVVVEVARELKEFSGMTAKQISAELNSRLKDFKSAVAYLEKFAPKLPLTGGIIRKCRIAMDLGWRCPFTGETYHAYDLPDLEREHIIPYATRNTNALHALVLTWPEVNRMKGKRTARQFISDCGGQQVQGRTNLSILTLRNYDTLVEKLDIKGHDDDRRRKKARKALLATTDFEDKELGFTERQLTQTSQLMKLAMGSLNNKRAPDGTRVFEGAHIAPIPGPVTAEIRKSWRIVGTLALACPEVLDEQREVRPKNEIRAITHLHHALDAATLALAAHYFPLRQNGRDQSGLIWQALMKRRRTDQEKAFLHGLGIFESYQRTRGDHQSAETDVRLKDLDREVKEALARSLAEGRVMQHVPSDRSGAKAELTTWGVVSTEGEGDESRVLLRQRTSVVEDGRRKTTRKTREERAGKLLGLEPKAGLGKLKAISGAMIIGENYGLALDPSPTVVPFHDVHSRLAALQAANGGRPVRVLRNGMLIRLTNQGARDGVWRINSIKASLKLDLSRPHVVGQPSKGIGAWREVSVPGLLNKGIEILPRRYSGHHSRS